MPLVAAAVVPHAPVLLPTIAGDHAPLTEQTRQALTTLGEDFLAHQVETIVVLTPHAAGIDETLGIVVGERLRVDLSSFGDVTQYPVMKNDWELAQALRSEADDQRLPSQFIHVDSHDYGTGIPLLAGQWSTDMRIISLAIAPTSREQLVRMSAVLHDVLHQTKRRVAFVASVDLDERSAKVHDLDRPTAWERAVATAVRSGKPEELSSGASESCGSDVLRLFFHVLAPYHAQGQILSFQAPFRIGYLVADIHLRR